MKLAIYLSGSLAEHFDHVQLVVGQSVPVLGKGRCRGAVLRGGLGSVVLAYQRCVSFQGLPGFGGLSRRRVGLSLQLFNTLHILAEDLVRQPREQTHPAQQGSDIAQALTPVPLAVLVNVAELVQDAQNLFTDSARFDLVGDLFENLQPAAKHAQQAANEGH